jgi:uncharacterized lipoprotein YbaY/heat shock protein HslJ
MQTASFAPLDAARLVFLPLLMACGSSTPSIDATSGGSVVSDQTVTGRATYREQTALPADATFEAVLLDVSRVDAPATAIGRRRIENPGPVPISFSIPYDSTLIDPRRNYVVRASIKVGDKVMWVSSRAHQVLTQGTDKSVSILMRRLGSTETEIPEDLLLSGEMTYLSVVARLTECTTNRIFPIAGSGDFQQALRVYRTMSRAAGAPLYVTFDGAISERPHPRGTGQTAATIVVREFVDAWPNQTCAAATENAPLLGTRWHITRLGDRRLTEVIGRSDPNLLLTGQGDSLTYSATVGCNGIGGKATRTGDEIAFGVGTGTMMSCGAPLDSLERRLIDALTRTMSWRILGNTLEFEDEDGSPAILFEAPKRR